MGPGKIPPERTMGCKSAPMSLRRPQKVDKVRQALQDVSGGDDDDGNGGEHDPGGDESHGGRGCQRQVKERLGFDDAVVDSAVEGDVKDTKPTVKPEDP